MLLRLAISQMLFSAIFQFSNLFINTYFFRLHDDTRIVAEYNFWLFVTWTICFYLGFQLCARNTRYGIAIAGTACLVGMVVLLSGSTSAFWLGVFLGASGGFFWPSYLSIYRTLGKVSEGGATFAKVSSLAYTVTIFIPIMFGFIVEGKGYIIGFSVLLLLSVCMILMSLLLPAFKTEKIVLRFSSIQHPKFLIANILHGVYFSFIGIAAGLLVFMSGKGEAAVGTFATFYGMLTLTVNMLLAYVIPKRYLSSFMLLSSMVYLISSTLFLTDWNYSVIIFNFLIAAAGPLYGSTYMGLQFSYINKAYVNGEEGLFMRELGLSIGRLLFFSYMIIAGMDVNSLGFYIFLFTASFFPLIVYSLMRGWDRESPG